MENGKHVATAPNNIANLNLSGAIDKGQCEKVVEIEESTLLPLSKYCLVNHG